MNENNIDDRYTPNACKEIRMKVMNYHYIQRALRLWLISNQKKYYIVEKARHNSKRNHKSQDVEMKKIYNNITLALSIHIE